MVRKFGQLGCQCVTLIKSWLKKLKKTVTFRLFFFHDRKSGRNLTIFHPWSDRFKFSWFCNSLKSQVLLDSKGWDFQILFLIYHNTMLFSWLCTSQSSFIHDVGNQGRIEAEEEIKQITSQNQSNCSNHDHYAQISKKVDTADSSKCAERMILLSCNARSWPSQEEEAVDLTEPRFESFNMPTVNLIEASKQQNKHKLFCS